MEQSKCGILKEVLHDIVPQFP